MGVEGPVADDGSMGSGRPGAAVGRDRGGEAPTDAVGRPMSRQSPPGTRDGGFDPEASRLNRQLRRHARGLCKDESSGLREQLDASTKSRREGRRASRPPGKFSTTQLQDEIYDLSTKIVGEGEKNRLLAETLTKVTAERDTLVADAESTESIWSAASPGREDGRRAQERHDAQLVELRERSMELEGRQSKTIISKRTVAAPRSRPEAPPASSEPTPEGNEAVAAAIKRLEGDREAAREVAPLGGRA